MYYKLHGGYIIFISTLNKNGAGAPLRCLAAKWNITSRVSQLEGLLSRGPGGLQRGWADPGRGPRAQGTQSAMKPNALNGFMVFMLSQNNSNQHCGPAKLNFKLHLFYLIKTERKYIITCLELDNSINSANSITYSGVSSFYSLHNLIKLFLLD